MATIDGMPANPQQQHEADGLKLADVLEKLAGVLEEQTRTLLDLKSEVGSLSGTLKEIENRLAAIEGKRIDVPDSTTPKPKAKKRPK